MQPPLRVGHRAEQAFCTNNDCRIVTFDPSLPDGGLSQAAVIDLGSPSEPETSSR
jgi:hypothetical protein